MCTDAHAHKGLLRFRRPKIPIRLMQMSESSACNNPEKDFTAFGSACVEMQMDANVAPGTLVLLTTKDPHFFHQPNVCRHKKWPHCATVPTVSSSPGGQANSDWRRWGIWFQWSPGLRSWNHLKSLEITWNHLKSLEITWNHLKSLEITWNHLKSLEITWNHLKSLEITWNHLKSLEITWISRDWDERIETLRFLYIFVIPKIVIHVVDRQAQLVENGGDLGLLAAGSKMSAATGFHCMTLWWTVFHQWLLKKYTDYLQRLRLDYTWCSASGATGRLLKDQCLESTSFDLGASPTSVQGLELQWLLFTSPSDSLQVVPPWGFWVNFITTSLFSLTIIYYNHS